MAKKRRSGKKKKKSSKFVKKLSWAIVIILIGLGYYFKDSSIGYYDRVNGLSGADLKTAMHEVIRDHKVLDFDDRSTARYWWDTYFKQTDWHSEGYFLDMYSNEQHRSYLGGNYQNREHCMPRSWWGVRSKYSSYDANGDLYNIFPSDYTANSAKSNLPLGEVGIAKFDNGVSKIGNNTYPKGYRGQVFEPADEYKGDFARVYFYMITCYEDYSYNWTKSATNTMLQKGVYPCLQPWALEMLIKWSKEDPISEKEIKRNKEVYAIQDNRNPFVDCPELIDHIWGDKSDQPFYIDSKTEINREPYLIDIFYRFLKDAKQRIILL